MIPSFILLGGPRCGTTWVHNCLIAHPMVFVPGVKELHYFTAYYNKGQQYYENFFVDAEKSKYEAVGECSPSYLSDKKCPERVAKAIPDARLIAILRNPVERAYSHYMMFKRNHSAKSFEESLASDPVLLEAGLYYDALMRYYEYFDKQQILVLLFDDLKLDPLAFIQKIYGFIGVDCEFVPSILEKPSNIVMFPRIQDLMYKLKIDWIIDMVKQTPLDKYFRDRVVRNKAKAYPDMNSDTKKRLQQYYLIPNEKLAVLLGRDLSAWN